MLEIKEIGSFKDYGRCLSIANGVIEAYVTVDVGPRIIRFGYAGGQNIMSSDRQGLGGLSDDKYREYFGGDRKWENFGGHRIWLSPESYPETYSPDDKQVEYKVTANGALFTPTAETENGVVKTLEISMDDNDTNMQVKMTSKNIADRAQKFAIWGLSVSEKGGSLIIPMNSNDTGLLSNRIISVWPYTDMSDKRIYWGNKYVTVKQDEKAEKPIKLGFDLNCGAVYYVLGEDVFCKEFAVNHPNGVYPDGGCSFETYTNDRMIEIETLGELQTVLPGETIEHIESWSLCKKPCEIDFESDASIDNFLSKI